MHKIQSVLPFTYATSDWLERRKRKIIVIQELNHLQPRLKLCNEVGDVRKSKWRNFKYKHHISNATLNILLDALGKDFFAYCKEQKDRNKFCDDPSHAFPQAEAFFRHFLKVKGQFLFLKDDGIRLREFDSLQYEFSDNWKLQFPIQLVVMDF